MAEQKPRRCDSCGGTGKYQGRATARGVVGAGVCFRCNGKGQQTAEDEKRNRYYDVHVRTRFVNQ